MVCVFKVHISHIVQRAASVCEKAAFSKYSLPYDRGQAPQTGEVNVSHVDPRPAHGRQVSVHTTLGSSKDRPLAPAEREEAGRELTGSSHF